MKTAKGGRKHRSAVSFCCDSSFAAPRGGRDANPPADYDVNPISTRAPRTGRDERAHLIELGVYLFQSSRPVWGATLLAWTTIWIAANFNPRAPYGARQNCTVDGFSGNGFQSARPVRGATASWLWKRSGSRHFNPRAPCGARLLALFEVRPERTISIRAPRAGRDLCWRAPFPSSRISILAPRAGRDGVEVGQTTDDLISILAPHAGRDA